VEGLEGKRVLITGGAGGIGIERLTRYVCNLDHIKEARLFPKVPGAADAL